MNFRRQIRKRRAEQFRRSAGHTDTMRMTRKAMLYQCETCENTWRMWLEVGLEEGGDTHKPVPYCIPCKYCGGLAVHIDWHKDINLEGAIPIFSDLDYFANRADRDCGVPVYVEVK